MKSCNACTGVDAQCKECSDVNSCTTCNDGWFKDAAVGTKCNDCTELNADCTTCTDASTCDTCGNDLIAEGN